MHILHYFKFGSASLQGRNSKQSKICISQLDYLDCKTFSVHKYASHALWHSLKLHNPSNFITHFAYARKLDKKDILWVCWYARKYWNWQVILKIHKIQQFCWSTFYYKSHANFVPLPWIFQPSINIPTSVHKYKSHALWRSLKLHNPSDFIPHFAYARKLDKKDILLVCWYAKKILKLTVEFKKFKLGLVQTCVGRLTSWKKNYLYASMLLPRFQFSNTFFCIYRPSKKIKWTKKK